MLAKEKMGPLDWDPDIIALTGKVPVTKKKREKNGKVLEVVGYCNQFTLSRTLLKKDNRRKRQEGTLARSMMMTMMLILHGGESATFDFGAREHFVDSKYHSKSGMNNLTPTSNSR